MSLSEETLIISFHHRQMPLFEEGMQYLWDAGFRNIWIFETGLECLGPYLGPRRRYESLGLWSSYDGAQVELKRRLSSWHNLEKIRYLVWIDNDCFLYGASYFQRYLEAATTYDYVSHFESPSQNVYEQLRSAQPEQLIYTVDSEEQRFDAVEVYPGFKPNPHWENSYMIMSREGYNQLTQEEISHGRLWISAVHRRGLRMGAHKVNYEGRYTHYGPEWLHVGNFMATYGRLEDSNTQWLFDKEDLLRLGYIKSMCAKSMVYEVRYGSRLAELEKRSGLNFDVR